MQYEDNEVRDIFDDGLEDDESNSDMSTNFEELSAPDVIIQVVKIPEVKDEEAMEKNPRFWIIIQMPMTLLRFGVLTARMRKVKKSRLLKKRCSKLEWADGMNSLRTRATSLYH